LIQPRAQSALTRADRDALAQLLPAIHSTMLDANFLSCELIEHAVIDTPLKLALAAAGGRDEPGKARSLGRLLARAEGCAVEGLVVQRVGPPQRRGALWTVRPI